MFFILDIMPGLKVLKVFTGTCRHCKQQGALQLVKTYQCLRLFFIPIFKWGSEYKLVHECGAKMLVSEEDAIAMMHAGVSPDAVQVVEVEEGIRRCRACGRVLEKAFICCPYCGEKDQ